MLIQIQFWLLLSVLLGCDLSSAVCTCKNQTWCNVVPVADKIVMGFSYGFLHYKQYDWSRINTVAPFNGNSTVPMEILCYAHSHGVSVLLPAYVSKETLFNSSKHSEKISSLVQIVQSNFIDGLNFDVEIPLTLDESKYYVKFVSETRAALRAIHPDYQVSVDVAWSTNCIDGRCYDSVGLSQASDYLVIMAYDEQSQMPGPPCYAFANSPFNQTVNGIDSYLKAGIDKSRLVLGLPWYGYKYTCLSVDSKSGRCKIEPHSFRNASCSDAAGQQISYGAFMNMLQEDGIYPSWSSDALSPLFTIYEGTAFSQYWYDDPVSLGFKYNLASEGGLRGIAIWNIDQLDYSDSLENYLMRQEMWQALEVF